MQRGRSISLSFECCFGIQLYLCCAFHRLFFLLPVFFVLPNQAFNTTTHSIKFQNKVQRYGRPNRHQFWLNKSLITVNNERVARGEKRYRKKCVKWDAFGWWAQQTSGPAAQPTKRKEQKKMDARAKKGGTAKKNEKKNQNRTDLIFYNMTHLHVNKFQQLARCRFIIFLGERSQRNLFLIIFVGVNSQNKTTRLNGQNENNVLH